MKCEGCGEERKAYGEFGGMAVCSPVCAVTLERRGHSGTLRVWKTEPAPLPDTCAACGVKCPPGGFFAVSFGVVSSVRYCSVRCATGNDADSDREWVAVEFPPGPAPALYLDPIGKR